jgi:2-ketocyclohexanecarboxyl-CoA hydrolase
MAEYSDIAFHIHEGIARLTINRPDRYNAFRARTCELSFVQKVGELAEAAAGV